MAVVGLAPSLFTVPGVHATVSEVAWIGAAWKVAVTVPGPLIVAVVELDAMFATDIDPVLLQDEKTKPGSAEADIGTTAAASYHVVAEGVTTPCPLGDTAKDT